ncbi:MAG TPA: hypothetical protein VGB52_04605 [Actinomycetota bacterium]
MKKWIAAGLAAGALLIPAGSLAHEYVSQSVCTSMIPAAEPSNDCVRVDTDTEFEDGVIVTVDGDDSDPRGDGTTDGYVAIEVTRDGPAVYCESDGGFNHIDDRPGGTEDDANGDNDPCEP